jgi:hypothetical protein
MDRVACPHFRGAFAGAIPGMWIENTEVRQRDGGEANDPNPGSPRRNTDAMQ